MQLTALAIASMEKCHRGYYERRLHAYAAV
jgi:hypothetical protein